MKEKNKLFLINYSLKIDKYAISLTFRQYFPIISLLKD